MCFDNMLINYALVFMTTWMDCIITFGIIYFEMFKQEHKFML